MKIQSHDVFHTPEGWQELERWIGRHSNPLERVHVLTAAMMAWNLAAKVQQLKPKDMEYWDNDEKYPVEDWQLEVANGDTREGYWDWVEARMKEEDKDGNTE